MNITVDQLYAYKKDKLKNRRIEEQISRVTFLGRKLLIELADLKFMILEERDNKKIAQTMDKLLSITSFIILQNKKLEVLNDNDKTTSRTQSASAMGAWR